MKPAPNWQCTSDPVDGIWKQDLLRWIGKELSIPTLFETGTCEGSTPAAVFNDFGGIYSVELSPLLHAHSVERLKNYRNVNLYQGDSRAYMRELLPGITGKILFWLDAHHSGGPTVGFGDDPLTGELQIIDEMVGPDRAVIVIDDQHGSELPLVMANGVTMPRWTRDFRTGELMLYGSLKVPPFEVE